MKRALLTFALTAMPLAAFAQESVRLASFDRPVHEVYTTLIDLAMEKGYTQHGLVSPGLLDVSASRLAVPVGLYGTHLSVQVAGPHVDLYVRHLNHHSFLLAAPLKQSIHPATRRHLEAFVKALRSRLSRG